MLKLETDLVCEGSLPTFGYISKIPVNITNVVNQNSLSENLFNVQIPTNIVCTFGCVLELFTNDGFLICTNLRYDKCPDLNIGNTTKKYLSIGDLKCLCDISRGLQLINKTNVLKIVLNSDKSIIF